MNLNQKSLSFVDLPRFFRPLDWYYAFYSDRIDLIHKLRESNNGQF